MPRPETPGAFHERYGRPYTAAGQFNVYKVETFSPQAALPPNRRDFYKISLILKCEGLLSYADQVVHIKNNALVFGNPLQPYAWKRLSDQQTGYFCMFTEDFITPGFKTESLAASPLFQLQSSPVLFPDKAAMRLLTGIYEQMLREMQSSYANKYDIQRSYVQLILHEALKIAPPEHIQATGTSPQRITRLFFELLERQFPITAPGQVLLFRNAADFATQLSIHTNHLNRSLKAITGKTTSILLSERLLREARALLLHSNWDIAEIGYCLGFEHPSNFNIFFKKQTGQTPNHFRHQFSVPA